MEKLIQWWTVNGSNIISTILSSLISLAIADAYYRKENRNYLQMVMIFPIIRLLDEHYSKENYKVLSKLSRNYFAKYLTKSERRILTRLILIYKKVITYDEYDIKAIATKDYFEYLLKSVGINLKDYPLIIDGEIIDYDYPPDWYYLEDELKYNFEQYTFENSKCKEAIIFILSK